MLFRIPPFFCANSERHAGKLAFHAWLSKRSSRKLCFRDDSAWTSRGMNPPTRLLAQRDSNPRVQESKSCALPLGDGPKVESDSLHWKNQMHEPCEYITYFDFCKDRPRSLLPFSSFFSAFPVKTEAIVPLHSRAAAAGSSRGFRSGSDNRG